MSLVGVHRIVIFTLWPDAKFSGYLVEIRPHLEHLEKYISKVFDNLVNHNMSHDIVITKFILISILRILNTESESAVVVFESYNVSVHGNMNFRNCVGKIYRYLAR